MIIKRIDFLDYAKAIAIFFVISVHVGFDKLNNIFLFVLPLFFVVTGYTFTLGKRSLKENIILRFKSIMIPFWIFMILYTCIDVLRAYLFEYGNYEVMFSSLAKSIYGSGIIPFNNNLTEYFKEMMSYKSQPTSGVDIILPASCHLWFLPATFIGYVMFASLVKPTRDKPWLKLICIIALILFSSLEVVFPSLCQLPFGIGRGALGAAFMLVGYSLKDKEFFENKSFKFNVIIFVLSSIIFVSSLCLGSDGSAFVRSYYGPYGILSVFITFIGGTCGVILLLKLCCLIDKIPFAKVKSILSFIGKNVMVFYVFHMLFKFVLDAIYINCFHYGEDILLDEYKMALLPENSMLYMIFEVFIILVLCFLFVKIYNKCKENIRVLRCK